tara:strand:- start:35 stop:550 length:516 start_codon:yes stop_codon:yes gene_type:complete
MASELHVDSIKHSGGTSAITIDSSGNVHKAGMIVQVQSAQLLSSSQYSTTAQTYSDIHSVTITPKFSSSKILFQLAGEVGSNGDNTAILLKVIRNIGGGSFTTIGGGGFCYENNNYEACALSIMDSPSTTNACIYKLQGARSSTNGTAYYPTNWSIDSTEGNTITVMEIAQ